MRYRVTVDILLTEKAEVRFSDADLKKFMECAHYDKLSQCGWHALLQRLYCKDWNARRDLGNGTILCLFATALTTLPVWILHLARHIEDQVHYGF